MAHLCRLESNEVLVASTALTSGRHVTRRFAESVRSVVTGCTRAIGRDRMDVGNRCPYCR